MTPADLQDMVYSNRSRIKNLKDELYSLEKEFKEFKAFITDSVTKQYNELKEFIEGNRADLEKRINQKQSDKMNEEKYYLIHNMIDDTYYEHIENDGKVIWVHCTDDANHFNTSGTGICVAAENIFNKLKNDYKIRLIEVTEKVLESNE